MEDNTYLGHIFDAITAIEKYVSGLTFEQFATSAEGAMARDAVVRQFEIIGDWSAVKDDLPPLKKFLADKVNPKLL